MAKVKISGGRTLDTDTIKSVNSSRGDGTHVVHTFEQDPDGGSSNHRQYVVHDEDLKALGKDKAAAAA